MNREEELDRAASIAAFVFMVGVETFLFLGTGVFITVLLGRSAFTKVISVGLLLLWLLVVKATEESYKGFLARKGK